MTDDALESRLQSVQEAMIQALAAGDVDSLPGLVSSREADFRELASRITHDQKLRRWATQYLARDQDIVSTAESQRDQLAAQLLEVQRTKSVHRLYLSEGTRR